MNNSLQIKQYSEKQEFLEIKNDGRFEKSIENSHSKQLENKKLKQLVLGNGQITGEDGDAWEKGNRQGKT